MTGHSEQRINEARDRCLARAVTKCTHLRDRMGVADDLLMVIRPEEIKQRADGSIVVTRRIDITQGSVDLMVVQTIKLGAYIAQAEVEP